MSRKCNRKLAMRRRLQGPTDRVTRAAAVFGTLDRHAVLKSTNQLERDLQIKLSTVMHAAYATLRSGTCTLTDMAALAYACDAAIVMAEADLGREYLPTLQAAQLAVIAVMQRQSKRGGRWICTGPELTAIEEMLPIHDGQLESTDCTEGFITRIADEIDRRRQLGHFTMLMAAAASVFF